jgi:hypothetical protein
MTWAHDPELDAEAFLRVDIHQRMALKNENAQMVVEEAKDSKTELVDNSLSLVVQDSEVASTKICVRRIVDGRGGVRWCFRGENRKGLLLLGEREESGDTPWLMVR